MKDRVERLIEKMPAELDAVLVTSPVGRQYFTGMHSTAGTVLITREGGYFLIDFRYILAARAAVQSCEVILQDKLYDQLGELLTRHGVKRVGVEDAYMTLAEAAQWQKKLPAGVRLDTGSSAGEVIAKMRQIKAPGEVAAMRAAQQIAEQGFSHILSYIRPGRTEREIACELIDFTGRKGSERPSFDFIVVSGENSAKPHGVPTDKPVQAGEFITLDFGCMIEGYCSDMTRTICLGAPTDRMCMIYDTVLRAQLAALDVIRPDVPCKQVDAAARELIDAAGFAGCFGHGLGHSLGLEIHESPRFSTADESRCIAGLMMTVEPGVYLEGEFGVRIEDMVLVTETGYENLTSAPKELIVL